MSSTSSPSGGLGRAIYRLDHLPSLSLATCIRCRQLMLIAKSVRGSFLLSRTEPGYHQFTEWAQKYGPIYSLKAGSQTIVVLTGPAEIKELMDRRSATTSERPPLHVANELSKLLCTSAKHSLIFASSHKWASSSCHALRRALETCPKDHSPIYDYSHVRGSTSKGSIC